MKSFCPIILNGAEKSSEVLEDPAEAFGAVASNRSSLEALLIPKPAKHGSGRKHYYHYDVVINGEVIVSDAWEPIFETAGALLAKGITGAVTFLDNKTLKPRLIIKDIENAAKLTVIENRREGPRFGKWRPFGGQSHE
jgi:hypothetical protein